MAHIIKFKSSAMGQIFAHINRERDQISKYGNLEIDPAKTPQNFELLHGDIEKLQKRLDEVSHTHRKDLVACCGVVITLPNELKNAEIERQKDFFAECHGFLASKFGKENALYSVVHFDETTPHLHFGFVPVVEKERKYRSKAKAGQTYTEKRICAKEVITKELLRSFHDELQEHISKTFPEVRLVAEDKQKRMKQSKSIQELKEETKKRMKTKEKQLDRVCFEANVWKNVAESWQADARKIAEKAERTAKKEAEEKAQKIAKAEAQKQIQQAQEAIESLRNLADNLAKRKFEKKASFLGKVILSADEYADLYAKATLDEDLKNANQVLNALSNKHLQDLEKASKDLKSQNEALKNENESLKEQSKIDSSTIKSLKNQKDSYGMRIDTLIADNKKLKEKYDALKSTVNDVWKSLTDSARKAFQKLGIGKSQGRSM